MEHLYRNYNFHRFNGTLRDIHEVAPIARTWLEILSVDISIFSSRNP